MDWWKITCWMLEKRGEVVQLLYEYEEGMVRKVSDGECKMGLVGMVVFFSLF